MNETNRSIIILLAGLWIVLMAVLIFVTWAADTEVVERLQDFVQYLDDHRDNPSRLVLTLGALVLVILALLVIILEIAPEETERELKVEQAGSTTIVPAEALRLRLEEALLALPQVTAAKVRVSSRDKGIATSLDLTVVPEVNVATVTQDAARVVADTLQMDLGLPVVGLPNVRIAFGAPKTAASSTLRPPAEEPDSGGWPSPPAEPAPPDTPAQEEPPGERPQP